MHALPAPLRAKRAVSKFSPYCYISVNLFSSYKLSCYKNFDLEYFIILIYIFILVGGGVSLVSADTYTS